VPAVNAWQCPADRGDPNYSCSNCFQGYGNSYCPEHTVDAWRVAHTTADSDPGWSGGGVPITESQIAISSANKILQGDWEWENQSYNLSITSGAWWHNYQNQRRFNMLFADGHVEFYLFPASTPIFQFGPPPDPTFLYW